MKEYAPYIGIILFLLGLLVTFFVWLVKQNNKKDILIAKLNSKVSEMEKQIASIKEKEKERERDNDWIKNKLAELSEMLAVAKNTIDLLILKNLKTNRT